ncbi:uncharacterized protein A4U43_C07F37570 [Asparagus officinalis]|uniref:Uncharacterized protein n=1 Tax=Asparagus officinalis TaxID=4686 RepID=A0A5P1EIA5_ASPOF|nr:uncharacterized protein A4U43_C07F37570 [Asparagus officinalis]
MFEEQELVDLLLDAEPSPNSSAVPSLFSGDILPSRRNIPPFLNILAFFETAASLPKGADPNPRRSVRTARTSLRRLKRRGNTGWTPADDGQKELIKKGDVSKPQAYLHCQANARPRRSPTSDGRTHGHRDGLRGGGAGLPVTGGVEEPPWLNYMREWGPKVSYDIANELKDVERFLPKKLRRALEDFVRGLPSEILGEEGPTGPKEKANWTMDEK